MKFKLPQPKSKVYTFKNSEGETTPIPSKTRKHLIKGWNKPVLYPDIELFTFLTEYFNEVSKKHKFLEVVTEPAIMTLDYMTYKSTKTTLMFPCGLINFHSRAKSLDITRVLVNKEEHGKGFGTFMMEMLFSGICFYFLETKKFPKVVLECVGSVGVGETFQQTPVHKQIKFFEKFGFELDRVNEGYHHMELTRQGLIKYVLNNPMLNNFVELK